MGKYKMLLILPFLLLLLFAWSQLGSYDKEKAAQFAKMEKDQAELIEKAENFAKDGIYFRAVDTLLSAKALDKTGTSSNNDRINDLLIEYYKADDDDGWTDIVRKKIKDNKAAEKEYLDIVDYYVSQHKFEAALDVLLTGVETYPENADMKRLKDKLMYQYSYVVSNYTEYRRGDMTAVYDGEKWGFLSNRGSISGDLVYDEATAMNDGFAAVKKDGKIFAVDEQMRKYAVCHDTDVTGVFLATSNGYVLKVGSKYRLYDREMNPTEFLYDYIGKDEKGIYPACNGSEWFLIDEEGKHINGEVYEEIALDEDNAAINGGVFFAKKNGRYILVGTDGVQKGGDFEDAYPFESEDGYAAVKSDGKWGFCDRSGVIVIQPSYDNARSYSDGLAPVMTGDDEWVYITSEGNTIIDDTYTYASHFKNGTALAGNDRMGMIILDNRK